MKAAVYRQYGSPAAVKVDDVETPSPKRNEVLVKIHATTVSSGDRRARSLDMPPGFGGLLARLVFGVIRPRQPILGSELAGVVAAVGADVTRFKIGDRVFAYPSFGMGCHAQYRTMPEDGRIVLAPDKFSDAQAAAISFGGATALYFLRDKARIEKGESVLVIGASGCVGSAAVQIAKSFGAQVTGVCGTANQALVAELGAHRTIDYGREDVTKSDRTYDVIFDTVGHASFSQFKKILNPGGRLVLVAAGLAAVLTAGPRSRNRRMIAGPCKDTTEHLSFLKQLCDEGAFTPVIDQRFSLDEIVVAHTRAESGRKRGSVVIDVAT